MDIVKDAAVWIADNAWFILAVLWLVLRRGATTKDKPNTRGNPDTHKPKTREAE